MVLITSFIYTKKIRYYEAITQKYSMKKSVQINKLEFLNSRDGFIYPKRNLLILFFF
jgi:hypothetical protein